MVKTMNLTVVERLLFGLLYPQRGSLKDMRIAKDLRRKVLIDEDERRLINLREEGGSLRWDVENVRVLALELNDEERDFLKRQVNRLDADEGFDQDLAVLAERIKEL
jgi:hypothetical protein